MIAPTDAFDAAFAAIDRRLPPMQEKIIAALRAHPEGLGAADLRRLIGSRGAHSVKVFIHHLRGKGFDIRSARLEGRPRKDAQGRSAERYKLEGAAHG